MNIDLLEVYYQYPELLEVYRSNFITTVLPKRICLAEYRCFCNQKLWYEKKEGGSAQTSIKPGRPILYPYKEKKSCKTFQVYYQKELSSITKSILTGFKNKYIYYAIEDLKASLPSNSFERNDILSVLYSSMLWLHNNQCINFFDIWIANVYIREEISKNRFVKISSKQFTNNTKITLVLFYKIGLPRINLTSLW